MRNSTVRLLLSCVLLLPALCGIAQERDISGTITDSNTGENVPGVNILVKGTNEGTTSDANGSFRLVVPEGNATLVFSFIGYKTLEVPVGNQTSFNISLEPDTKLLEEVVVVGYGTQKRADLTGAVGSLRASDVDIASKPITSVDQLMSGRISGIQMSNRSGDPGAPIDVRIRGVGTAGVNSPLWVIDGVPIVQTTNITVNTSSTTDSNPLAGINPADIESIDVLKDASAAAIYGSRAANGVIIVTTKRGKEGTANVTYDGFVGAGRPWNTLDVLNIPQYIAIQQQLGRDFSEFANE
ncbi:MAG TPA: carboxypeptidase-like regulatory domain-containing protein, partial [Chryseosolibacter sp.]